MKPLHHLPRFLLVGEGNFSFSASLCEVRGSEACIVATCYESEDTVSTQAFAKSNIQYLRDRGAEVHFCIDCTKLKDYFLPSERNFARIYFNFPHCGRKAGVKKNRELLARFFCSCADVLAEEGEVHVTLCRGQGGTPADQPVREWHNSWQIVAMAAQAGFILSEVHPFNIRNACGYSCTGYRSQDKPFCVEGALSHIFTRGLPFLQPRPVICQAELEGHLISFLVPEIFADKINRHFLDISSEHPVRTVSENLTDELGKSFPVQKVNSSISLVFQGSSKSRSLLDTSWMVPVARSSLNSKPVANKIGRNAETFVLPSSSPGWSGSSLSPDLESNWVLGQYYLRPSLLPFLHEVVQQPQFQPGTFLVLRGLAFRKSKISTHAPPIFHEMVFLCMAETGTEAVGLAHSLAGNLSRTLNSMLQPSGVQLCCTTNKPETAQLCIFEPQPHEFRYFVTVALDPSNADPKEVFVGTVSIAPWQPKSIGQEIVCASLNLDLLAMQVCGIVDWRMLWTPSRRFLDQFAGGRLGPFRNFSLYPPSYSHDISFWVPELERFDEAEFHALARRVSGETVVSVQLLDSFLNPKTAQTSLCYRVTYQSSDKALTGQQVAALQMKLREEAEHSLRVILR
ncbi:ferredoxin-fold anticodon-binding domain-containing protein 1 isoform X1 [Varanus komodoensis]|uniref:phenylalanine--tRNA ligase n=1 Tax=Varanus komodoensis TaxID=61221 RepID=A0A8D2LMD2_VARKO|nr:ferredoxin-fold anticodon-binding domain-containing protein 1 isoform X1 [Varanus komodoensis]XP_044312249.1 ferredoxin-fold anticodon-binding domain-containing protein 1 isoform X1 [Varanus komodoensis]